ncbi:unnamed protein product [Closterium sp. NIES-65]|nr:unnamed protein product [Closterium sp. NIES-65]
MAVKPERCRAYLGLSIGLADEGGGLGWAVGGGIYDARDSRDKRNARRDGNDAGVAGPRFQPPPPQAQSGSASRVVVETPHCDGSSSDGENSNNPVLRRLQVTRSAAQAHPVPTLAPAPRGVSREAACASPPAVAASRHGGAGCGVATSAAARAASSSNGASDGAVATTVAATATAEGPSSRGLPGLACTTLNVADAAPPADAMDLGSLLVRGGKDVPRSPRPPPGSPSGFRRAHHFRSASVGGFITHAADGGVDSADYTLPPLSPQPPRRIPAAAALFSASADGGRHLQLLRDATPGIAPAAASVSPPRGPPASPLSAVAGRFAGNGGRGSAAAESQPRAQEGGEESEGEGESSAWEWESESESELEWEEFVVVARALGGHDARGITDNTSNAQQQQAPGSPISKQQQLLGTAPGRPRQRKIASSPSAEFPAAVLLRSSRRASVSPPPVSPMRSSPRHASAVFPRSWSAGAPDAADAPDAPPARLPRSTLSAHAPVGELDAVLEKALRSFQSQELRASVRVVLSPADCRRTECLVVVTRVLAVTSRIPVTGRSEATSRFVVTSFLVALSLLAQAGIKGATPTRMPFTLPPSPRRLFPTVSTPSSLLQTHTCAPLLPLPLLLLPLQHKQA